MREEEDTEDVFHSILPLLDSHLLLMREKQGKRKLLMLHSWKSFLFVFVVSPDSGFVLNETDPGINMTKKEQGWVHRRHEVHKDKFLCQCLSMWAPISRESRDSHLTLVPLFCCSSHNKTSNEEDTSLFHEHSKDMQGMWRRRWQNLYFILCLTSFCCLLFSLFFFVVQKKEQKRTSIETWREEDFLPNQLPSTCFPLESLTWKLNLNVLNSVTWFSVTDRRVWRANNDLASMFIHFHFPSSSSSCLPSSLLIFFRRSFSFHFIFIFQIDWQTQETRKNDEDRQKHQREASILTLLVFRWVNRKRKRSRRETHLLVLSLSRWSSS